MHSGLVPATTATRLFMLRFSYEDINGSFRCLNWKRSSASCPVACSETPDGLRRFRYHSI